MFTEFGTDHSNVLVILPYYMIIGMLKTSDLAAAVHSFGEPSMLNPMPGHRICQTAYTAHCKMENSDLAVMAYQLYELLLPHQ